MENVLFVTGTDTGVGKTLVTCLLLAHLRGKGRDVVAMKPFSSGERSDARVIQAFQAGVLTEEEMNPYHFKKPLAPVMAARAEGRRIGLEEVIQEIGKLASRHEGVVVEGVGGVMVPLGEGYGVADLVEGLGCRVLLVGRNRLGTINHTLLSVGELRRRTEGEVKVVLSGVRDSDESALGNASILREYLGESGVEELPYLRGGKGMEGLVKKNFEKLKIVLDRISVSDSFTASTERGSKPKRPGQEVEKNL